MRKKSLILTAAAMPLLMLVAGGCDLFGGLTGVPRTTVVLQNNSDFPITVKVFYHDEQLTVDGVIQLVGVERDFVIAAGATETFSEPCDELQSVIVDDADLQVVGGAGPETRSGVLRDGTDFGCRDTITFTFDHSILLVDFDLTTNVSTP